MGNRTWTKRDGGTGDVFGYDYNDQVTAVEPDIAKPDTTAVGLPTIAYDTNRNLLSDGANTFEWDAVNRLTAVNSGTSRSEFTYNGLSQRVKIVEKTNGAVTSTKQLVWCPGEAQPCEERDASNNVTKRYYGQGVMIGSTKYLYTRDHLGSIRELTDSSGSVQTRYDYDPYGRRTRLTGTIDADFGFTGHYYHQPSGLHLALFRAYDADLGRWISRDPIREASGFNLYAYVAESPVTEPDILGLYPLRLNVTTVIRPPAAEAGVKTSQTIVVETTTGEVTAAPPPFVGSTTIAGFDFPGSGTFTNAVTTFSTNSIGIDVTGVGQSFFLQLTPLSIIYDVTLTVDLTTGEAEITGLTNGFPSYEVFVDGTEVFDFQQRDFLDLAGNGDIPFDVKFTLDENGKVVRQRNPCP